MENEILTINILSIAISGLLMLASGAALYFLKGLFNRWEYSIFLADTSPIGVAAYIFVFNMFKP